MSRIYPAKSRRQAEESNRDKRDTRTQERVALNYARACVCVCVYLYMCICSRSLWTIKSICVINSSNYTNVISFRLRRSETRERGKAGWHCEHTRARGTARGTRRILYNSHNTREEDRSRFHQERIRKMSLDQHRRLIVVVSRCRCCAQGSWQATRLKHITRGC